VPIAVLAGAAALVAVASCAGPGPRAVAPAPGTDRADLAADSTAKVLRGRPFHQDARALDLDGQKSFAAGAEVFQHPITVTPAGGGRAPFSPRHGEAPRVDATGPLFVETTCMTCHVDGTGATVAAPGPGLVVKVAAAAGAATGQAHPTLGHQLSTDAVAGASPEGTATIRWEQLSGRYADGTSYTLRRPLADIGGSLAARGGPAAVSLRVAPPLLGLGFLESIPAASVAAAADPDDANHDGISGRVPRGRFGWKGSQPTVRSQTVSALAHDMGVTTGESPDPCEDRPVDCDPTAPGMSSSPGRPELFGQPFDDLIVYTEAIAVPRARHLDAPPVRRGAEAFTSLGCAACHTPTQRTGSTRSTTASSTSPARPRSCATPRRSRSRSASRRRSRRSCARASGTSGSASITCCS
jgi:CxxC motif-containing protein (DUF1111 family)